MDRNNHLVNAPAACAATGVDQVDLSQFIRIFPNPARDVFMVSSSFEGSLNMEIMDMAGRVLMQQVDLNIGQPVQINALAKGMYLVKLRNAAGETAVKKLIVE